VLGLGAGALAWRAAPLPAAITALAIGSALTVGLAAWQRRWTVGAAHLAAALLVLGLARTTDQALDYYRLWAGSARRLGDTDGMVRAYRGVLRLDPLHGPANYYLGRHALGRDDLDAAYAHFRAAQLGQPDVARGWLGEAEVLLARGDRDGALVAIKAALRAQPNDRDAAAMLARVRRGEAPAPRRPDGADEP
jgi:tetratricopeptide (TPR) repeat protein